MASQSSAPSAALPEGRGPAAPGVQAAPIGGFPMEAQAPPPPRDVAEMFVNSALHAIQREATGRRHASLRREIQAFSVGRKGLWPGNAGADPQAGSAARKGLGKLRRGSVSAAVGGGASGEVKPEGDLPSALDVLDSLPVLLLACESKSPRICELAIDCIQKLLSYRYIQSQNQVDGAVHAVCQCFAVHDENVWLQVVKAILAAEASFGVHDERLLEAIRTSLNIFLGCRSAVLHRTAHTVLTQITDTVFARLERTHVALQEARAAVQKEKDEIAVAAVEAVEERREEEGEEVVGVPTRDESVAENDGVEATEKLELEVEEERESLGAGEAGEAGEARGEKEEGVDEAEKEEGVDETEREEEVQEKKEEEVDETRQEEEVHEKKEGVDETEQGEDVHEKEERKDGAPPLPPRPSRKLEPTGAQGDSAATASPAAAAYSPPHAPPSPPTPTQAGRQAARADLAFQMAQKDAFLVFRSLCKLSAKNLSSNTSLESVDMRVKLLALERLLNALQHPGPAFRSSTTLVNAVRQHLFQSLLQNAVCPVAEVFSPALNLFLAVMEGFKEHLKMEIGVFFSNIFLAILKSANSTQSQKQVVLRILLRICRTPQMLVDIFLNYDCDLDTLNIFESLVNDLARIGQGASRERTAPAAAELEAAGQGSAENGVVSMRQLALECLVLIIDSMREWVRPFREELEEGMEGGDGGGGGGDGASHPDQSEGSETQSLHGEKDRASGRESALGESAAAAAAAPEASDVSAGEASGRSIGGEASASGGTSQNGRDVVEKYEKQKLQKAQFKAAVEKFNLHPRKGIAEFRARGFIGDSPRDVAMLFLRNSELLSKEQMGDYMGVKDQVNRDVMYAYVEALNFRGLSFDEALRMFLSGFLIPGESQIIDRFMEKFAERYCTANPKVFASADTAYVLAYSIIMLNTDAHNPRVQKKMSLEEFVRNNRGIDDSGDLSPDMLAGIYRSITTRKLQLRDDGDAGGMQAPGTLYAGPKSKRALYASESERMVERSKRSFLKLRRMRRGGGGAAVQEFYTAIHFEHVRPMFQTIWAPLMAAFSYCLEEEHKPAIFRLCLRGFKSSISLACVFYMETERAAFINALTKFTHLTNLREMTQKNIESIESLMEIAETEGNYLRSSWYQILKCVSLLERMQVIRNPRAVSPFAPQGVDGSPAAGIGGGALPGGFGAFMPLEPQSAPLSGPSTPQQRRRRTAGGDSSGGAAGDGKDPAAAALRRGSLSLSPGVHFKLTQRSIAATKGRLSRVEQLNSQVLDDHLNLRVTIDRIFANSVHLSADAVVDFVEQLCAISREEIGPGMSVPRIFSLQRIVEISDFNMGVRVRLVWSRLWVHLSEHFIHVAASSNPKVVEYALDSLRQLAMKFLEKDELANYHFQKEFLRPFLHIMTHVRTTAVREFVLICTQQMVLARASNIKSGWRTILGVLEVAAADATESIVSLGADTVHLVVREYLPFVSDAFVDCVKSLAAYVANPYFEAPSLKCVDTLRECGERLADGQVVEEAVGGGSMANDGKQAGLWFPVFTALSHVVSQHPKPTVRVRALEALLSLLRSHGALFSSAVWHQIFKGVLLPLFDDVQLMAAYPSLREPSEVFAPTLLEVVGLYARFFDRIDFLLKDVLGLLGVFLKQESQAMIRIGATAFAELFKRAGKLLGPEQLQLVARSLEELVSVTKPDELFTCEILRPELPTELPIERERAKLDGAAESEQQEGDVEKAVGVVEPRLEQTPERAAAGGEPKPERTEAEGEPQPERVEAEGEPQPERVEAEGEPQPERVEAGGEPQPERAEAEGEPQPEHVETEGEPQPEHVEAEGEPQPERAEAEGEPQPERVEAEVEPQPERVEAEGEPQPERVEAEGEPQPERVEAEVEPQPERVEAEGESQPERAEADGEPQPERAEAEGEPQPERVEAEHVEAGQKAVVAEVEAGSPTAGTATPATTPARPTRPGDGGPSFVFVNSPVLGDTPTAHPGLGGPGSARGAEPEAAMLRRRTLEVAKIEAARQRNRTEARRVAARIKAKSVAQFVLVQLCSDFAKLLHGRLRDSHFGVLLAALAESFSFARSFDADFGLRELLHKSGLLGPAVPSLLKQEVQAATAVLTILFRLHADVSVPGRPAAYRLQLSEFALEILRHFVLTCARGDAHAEAQWTPLVLLVLSSMSTEFSDGELAEVLVVACDERKDDEREPREENEAQQDSSECFGDVLLQLAGCHSADVHVALVRLFKRTRLSVRSS